MERIDSNIIGTALVEEGFLSEEQLVDALEKQIKTKGSLSAILIEMGMVKENDILDIYYKQLGITQIDLNSVKPDHAALRIISERLAERYLILPLYLDQGVLTLAMADPLDARLKEAIKFATGKEVTPVVALPTEIRKFIQKFYKGITNQRLGDILKNLGVITEEQLSAAIEIQEVDKRKLGEILISQGIASEKDIVRAYSEQLGIPYLDLAEQKVDSKALELIPGGIAERHLVFPIRLVELVLEIAMADPLDIDAINAIHIATGKILKVFVAGPTEIKGMIKNSYRDTEHFRLGEISVSAEYVKQGASVLPGRKRKRIGDILIDAGLITYDQLRVTLELQKKSKKKLGEILIESKMVKDEDIAKSYAIQLNIPYIDVSSFPINIEAVEKVPVQIANKHLLIPIAITESQLTVAMSNPLDLDAIDSITFVTEHMVKVVVSTSMEIRKAINRYYHNKQKRRLGDILVEMGFINEETLKQCLERQKGTREKIGDILLEGKYVKESDMYIALSVQMGVPFTDLKIINPEPEALEAIQVDYAEKHLLVPLNVKDNELIIAMANPLNLDIINNVRKLTGKQVIVTISSPTMIRETLQRSYIFADPLTEINKAIKLVENRPDEYYDENDTSGEKIAPIVRIVNNIIAHAIKNKSSDIHVEPRKEFAVVRNRIDGHMRDVNTLPKWVLASVVSRIKIMASLDISEKRLPQDGKIKFLYRNRFIELRVATLPVIGGESVVLRILTEGEPISIDAFKLSKRNYDELLGIISSPYGIILVVGPTGSGKTTTLHSVLQYINTPDRKIWTAEDPVEITQPGLNQVEIKPKIKLDFPRAMRAFLRADPDVIMVGEIRDKETAHIGIEAALTGHLVLSTLHTNNAPETVIRLIDIGLDPFNFADAILGVLAQRLVRILCPSCKKSYHPSREEFDYLVKAYGEKLFSELNVIYDDNFVLFRAGGCEDCEQIGYSGRTGIYELLTGTEEMKKLIRQKSFVEDIRKQAIQDGMRTLFQDGISKVIQGITDIDQVRRVCV